MSTDCEPTDPPSCAGCIGCGGPDCVQRPDTSGPDPDTARTDPDTTQQNHADQPGHDPDTIRTDLHITPYVCPLPGCVGGLIKTINGDTDRCLHCAGSGLTDDPMGGADRAPRPPGVMRTPCADCALRTGSPELEQNGATLPDNEPFYCHQGLPISADGRYQPVAMFRGLPLGAMVCAGWWALKTGEQIPAKPYREIPLGEDDIDRRWGDQAQRNLDRATAVAIHPTTKDSPVTRYDELSDDARNLMVGFDELDIAEIAADAQRSATRLRNQITKAETERDGAYRERAQLLAWLAALHPAVRTLAPDVTEPGWQILYLNPTTGGQMSWHIAPQDIELFEHVEYVPAGSGDQRALWDGHTTEQKYDRIATVTAELAQRCGPECAEGHAYTGRCESATTTTKGTSGRLLDCGLCYEENGEEVHPHPECALGGPVATAEQEPDDEDEGDDDPADSDSNVLALISEIASRLTDATDEGEYQAAGLIGDLANGRKTVEEARAELSEITFRHV